jgi:predicted metalloprotease
VESGKWKRESGKGRGGRKGGRGGRKGGRQGGRKEGVGVVVVVVVVFLCRSGRVGVVKGGGRARRTRWTR